MCIDEDKQKSPVCRLQLHRNEVSKGSKLRVAAEYEDGTIVESESIIVGGKQQQHLRTEIAILLSVFYIYVIMLWFHITLT